MDDWIKGACDRVDALAAQDPDYQELNRQRIELEKQCQKILNSLSSAEREILTQYEYVIMEMAYYRTQTAYRLGKRQPKTVQR